ncbi:hypothetical protein YC2023_032680 [Brassica napus]
MKISSQTLVFVTIALVLAFAAIRWHADVAAYARQYALRMRGDCRLIHSGGRYGENLVGSTGDLSGADAVRLWVNEKKDYFYNSNTCRVTVVELSLFAAMILLRLGLVFLTDSYELT